MRIDNRVVSLVWKTTLVLIALWGVYLNSGLPDGQFKSTSFLYYTIQSNLICLAYFAYAAIKCAREIGRTGIHGCVAYSPAVKGTVTMGIVVTLLIYWFVLVGANFSMVPNATTASNLTVHLIVPLMAVADWLLFDEKGSIRPTDPVKWLALPLYYMIFAQVAALLGAVYREGARYPYFFIDPDLVGWAGVAVNVVLVGVAFLVLGYLAFALDRLLGCWAARRAAKSADTSVSVP